MQTHGCPDFSCPERPLLFTVSQDHLPSFIAGVNIFGHRGGVHRGQSVLELQGMQLLTGLWAALN